MLRVKDLSRLEEFGFEKTSGNTYKSKQLIDLYNDVVSEVSLLVNPKGFYDNRLVVYVTGENDGELDDVFELDLVFDLIQAGLIEKVSE